MIYKAEVEVIIMVYCHVCQEPITLEVFTYSKKRFGQALCKKHQAEARRFRREARKEKRITPQARLLGNALIRMGWHVEFEKDDGFKRIDIAIVKCRMNIEVDGSQHNLKKEQALADLKRTYYSYKKGY